MAATTTTSRDPSRLDIAIVGAGIAGLTLAIALQQHPHINLQIYEQATVLQEIGASIALGPNGLRTLQRLGLDDVISDEVCFRGPSNLPMIYRHWKTNEVIGVDRHDDVDVYEHRTARFHRGHLHAALLAHVDRDLIHLGKRLSLVREDVGGEGVVLWFEDGTEARADVLVGCDGLRSGVRTALVPDYELKWSGWTAFRSIFDTSLVETILDLAEDSTHWWGPNTNFFASRLGKNTFTVVGGVNGNPDDPDSAYSDKNASWDKEANVKLLREKYTDWNPVVKALTEVTPDTRYYPNLSGGSLKTWVFLSGRVTLTGDAAHAHGGAFATGGSLAIDDAYAFYLSLLTVFPITRETKTKTKPKTEELAKALRLYEATRKPHAEKLLSIVHKANSVRADRLRRGVVETDVELRERARNGSGTNWLHEHDVVGAFEDTRRRLEAKEVETKGSVKETARL